ncbi:hypothetical protein [Curtobacterium sp. 20TX0008]|uniref:hypothetical protein n=1 Tax=Curtobacterium sp. 20TX0008 TaxID=3022018 RepID=UPI00232E5B96|nr:hypothetical protein [Curtobacterium sp. 20TX0008]MDB6427467.1 hypothetical protein [Curtobacterium sp. 20TX0008]
MYDTARSTPGASVDLRTFDEVLDAAVPNRAQQAAEPGNARDRIRANFAAQQSASFPQSAATQLSASAGQGQPAPTFRSGRGFGAPGRDSGVER